LQAEAPSSLRASHLRELFGCRLKDRNLNGIDEEIDLLVLFHNRLSVSAPNSFVVDASCSFPAYQPLPAQGLPEGVSHIKNRESTCPLSHFVVSSSFSHVRPLNFQFPSPPRFQIRSPISKFLACGSFLLACSAHSHPPSPSLLTHTPKSVPQVACSTQGLHATAFELFLNQAVVPST
jgi:hypothetical protein